MAHRADGVVGERDQRSPDPTPYEDAFDNVGTEATSSALQVQSTEWRPVPGHPGYEVSPDGRVRSVDREVVDRNGMAKRLRGRELIVDRRVTLSEPDQRRHTVSVRALVAAAWGGAS